MVTLGGKKKKKKPSHFIQAAKKKCARVTARLIVYTHHDPAIRTRFHEPIVDSAGGRSWLRNGTSRRPTDSLRRLNGGTADSVSARLAPPENTRETSEERRAPPRTEASPADRSIAATR